MPLQGARGTARPARDGPQAAGLGGRVAVTGTTARRRRGRRPARGERRDPPRTTRGAVRLGAYPLHVLLHTPSGTVCLAAGGVLEGLGLWWALRIMRGAEEAAA
ncbi:hypothetical protein [Streptomyces sp. E1N211]|uniref:hypothetical protein n=1 Tax=Streptomyces sp. E1N211 TaxID=1851876 RepID=UPI000EF6D935|nr:hypothetical protein [Streptomyces sp. E1N211]